MSLGGALQAGATRTMLTVGLGIAFVGVFIWLLILQMRRLLEKEGSPWPTIVAIALNLSLLIAAFGWMHHVIGIVDNVRSRDGQIVISHDFLTCIYYSVITFTTVGYGDFYPRDIGRFLAALQGLTGYVILGILASSGASLLHPQKQPELKAQEHSVSP